MSRRPIKDLRDAELVCGAMDGDSEAFGELYLRHCCAVTAAVRGNMCDRDAVEDVVQETFTKALERLADLREPAKFRSWVLQAARHAAVDHGRFRTRVLLIGDDDALESVIDMRDSPEDIAVAHERVRSAERQIAKLSPNDAMVIKMVSYADLRPAEVGHAMRISPGAAKVRLTRIRCNLRNACEFARAETC